MSQSWSSLTSLLGFHADKSITSKCLVSWQPEGSWRHRDTRCVQRCNAWGFAPSMRSMLATWRHLPWSWKCRQFVGQIVRSKRLFCIWCFGNLKSLDKKGFGDSSVLVMVAHFSIGAGLLPTPTPVQMLEANIPNKMQRQKLVVSASCAGIHQLDRQHIDIFLIYCHAVIISHIDRSLTIHFWS